MQKSRSEAVEVAVAAAVISLLIVLATIIVAAMLSYARKDYVDIPPGAVICLVEKETPLAAQRARMAILLGTTGRSCRVLATRLAIDVDTLRNRTPKQQHDLSGLVVIRKNGSTFYASDEYLVRIKAK